jgi:transposase
VLGTSWAAEERAEVYIGQRFAASGVISVAMGTTGCRPLLRAIAWIRSTPNRLRLPLRARPRCVARSGSQRLGRPRETDLRAIVDAILYIARTGCQWGLLPKDFPPFTPRCKAISTIGRDGSQC